MFSLTLLLFFLVSTTFAPSPTPTPPFTKIYAFGDSYTDTGNTRSATAPYAFGYVSNPPYGTTFFHKPTNRYSDGRLVVDFLSSALSLPFLPPFKTTTNTSKFPFGANFAVAGSTAIDHGFFVKNNMTLDITPQSIGTEREWFEGLMEREGCGRGREEGCALAMEGALFWVGEIGVNDYAYSVGSSVSTKEIQRLAVGSLAKFLEVILAKGAKHVVVQGLPMTGCLPLSLILTAADDRDNFGCSASVNQLSHAHNALLRAEIEVLRKRFPASTISYADYWAAHRAIMARPAAYGFTERFKTCCGSGGGDYNFNPLGTCGSPDAGLACRDPGRFVNWDGVHLTESMYRAVADMFFYRGLVQPQIGVPADGKARWG
ncbi:GDSL esterase/lipase [Acorus gramineus]|uniref:GDSL esterase/lipase n=1 Tax=Acorus gramineus TaxID=55184 RepID=A0AAV9AT45_ACOGR|nr:GDSL esterase/lipase [Acorus gramineus]